MGLTAVSSVPSQKIEPATQSGAIENRDRAANSQAIRRKEETTAHAEKQIAEVNSRISIKA